jgi:hypothetical protein
MVSGEEGEARTRNIRLWHNRTRATFTVTVSPSISTTA